MKKRGKTKELKGITLQFPSTSRLFRCREWGRVGIESRPVYHHTGTLVRNVSWPKFGWIVNHPLKDGDTLILCHERGCQTQLCQDHYPKHIQEHTLKKLGGEEK